MELERALFGEGASNFLINMYMLLRSEMRPHAKQAAILNACINEGRWLNVAKVITCLTNSLDGEERIEWLQLVLRTLRDLRRGTDFTRSTLTGLALGLLEECGPWLNNPHVHDALGDVLVEIAFKEYSVSYTRDRDAIHDGGRRLSEAIKAWYGKMGKEMGRSRAESVLQKLHLRLDGSNAATLNHNPGVGWGCEEESLGDLIAEQMAYARFAHLSLREKLVILIQSRQF